MIKSTANSNVKSTPSTPKAEGGIVGETPTHNLPQNSEEFELESWQLGFFLPHPNPEEMRYWKKLLKNR